MALNQVQYVAPAPEMRTTKGKSGGGKWGSAIGAVAGGIVGGMATGGAGAIGGAAAGSSLGGMLGNAISPATQGSTAMVRRSESLGAPTIPHSDRSEKLKQSIMALHTQPDEIKQKYASPLVSAYMKSLGDDNSRKGVA